MTKVNSQIAEMKDEVMGWRKELHQNPQTAYEETFASGFVTKKLEEWGIPFESGVAETGVVATIEGKSKKSGKIIGFRADMDALDIDEQTNLPYASKNPGKMHACGHDGHTASLLGVAKYLKENPDFNGTVRLIFQPAEEGGGGAYKMIEEGLLEKFPCDYIFAFHNWPYLEKGVIATRTGPLLAASDYLRATIKGKGGHAAAPHTTIDVAPIISEIILATQNITSRNISPLESAVISITNVNIGTGADSIIADTGSFNGTVRAFSHEMRRFVKDRLENIVNNIAAAHGASAEFEYEFNYDPTVNSEDGVAIFESAVKEIQADYQIDLNTQPTMAAEDFGAFLSKIPGAYILVGQAEDDKDSPHNYGLHSPFYDFNDDILPTSVGLFVELVNTYLPVDK